MLFYSTVIIYPISLLIPIFQEKTLFYHVMCLLFVLYFFVYIETKKMLDVVILTVIFVAASFLGVIYHYMVNN